MCKLNALILAAGVVVLTTSPAPAQQQPGRGPIRGGPNQFVLLRQPAVQEELKLTAEEKEKIKKLFEGFRDRLIEAVENGQRDKMAGLIQEQEKALPTVLNASQRKRLKEVFIQVQGLWALTDPGISKDLQITTEQKKKIQDLQKESEEAMKKLFQQGGAANRKDAQRKLADFHKQANEKGLALLTTAQQAKWKELSGEPFTREIRRVLPMGR